MTNEQLNVKYVDLQGLRLFAEELKKWLKSHVVETDIYKELLYRIENLELYKIVETLPEKGDEDTIYLLRNPNEEDQNLFIEYLYSKEHGWEEIGKFIPNIKLEEYLKIEDSPFEKGEGKNSAVLKSSGLNTAKGINSVAFGKAVVVNCNNGLAFGQNNVGNTNSIFEVGVGSDDRHRKNAYEITTDGKHYIYNLGGYDGTNPTSNNDLVSVINKIPIEQGKGSNSIIQKGHNNVATNTNTAVFGNENKVGINGYYYNFIKFTTIDDVVSATLYMVENNSKLVVNEPSVNKNFKNPYEVGDVVSIRNNSIWYNCGVIESILGNRVVITGLPFSEIVESTADREIFVVTKPDKGVKEIGAYAFVTGQKNQGFGKACHVEGLSNIITGNYSHGEGEKNILDAYASHVEGEENKVYGNYAHVEGELNEVQLNARYSHTEGAQNLIIKGQLSHVEGMLNKLHNTYDTHVEGKANIIGLNGSCNYSHIEGQTNDVDNSYNDHIEGYNNQVSNTEVGHIEGQNNEVSDSKYFHIEGYINSIISSEASHSEGRYNKLQDSQYAHVEGHYNQVTNAESSHVEGFNNVATARYQHVEGCCNQSNSSAIHIVGIGTSANDRKNAHEITVDGKHYIYGIGNYVGNNPSSSTDLATYVKSLETRIKQLEDIISQITEQE